MFEEYQMGLSAGVCAFIRRDILMKIRSLLYMLILLANELISLLGF